MLTDEQRHDLYLRVGAKLVDHIEWMMREIGCELDVMKQRNKELEEQNAQMKKAVESAIIHLQDGDLHIRASQLRNRLLSIQGGPSNDSADS